MKENNIDIMNYQAPVLRIVFRKTAGMEVVKQLPAIEIHNSEKTMAADKPEMGKNFPEFYQHHIKPKRFDFY